MGNVTTGEIIKELVMPLLSLAAGFGLLFTVAALAPANQTEGVGHDARESHVSAR